MEHRRRALMGMEWLHGWAFCLRYSDMKRREWSGWVLRAACSDGALRGSMCRSSVADQMHRDGDYGLILHYSRILMVYRTVPNPNSSSKRHLL